MRPPAGRAHGDRLRREELRLVRYSGRDDLALDPMATAYLIRVRARAEVGLLRLGLAAQDHRAPRWAALLASVVGECARRRVRERACCGDRRATPGWRHVLAA